MPHQRLPQQFDVNLPPRKAVGFRLAEASLNQTTHLDGGGRWGAVALLLQVLRRCLEVVKDVLLVLLGAGVPPPRAILAAASAQTLMVSVNALSTKQPAQFEYPAPYSLPPLQAPR